VADVIEEARQLKADAMKARDAGRFDDAHSLLNTAEASLKTALAQDAAERDEDEDPGDYERRLAAQVVHIQGSIAGVWRRQGRHEESASVYDTAYELERNDAYRMIDSYTLVQRLVARVLLQPAAADQDGVRVAELDVRAELRKAAGIVREQIERRGRKGDEFAAADLALVLLLLGDPAWAQETRAFLALKPGYALTATRDLLREVKQAVANAPASSPGLGRRVDDALGMLS
jgi:hypothetical protein